MMMIYLTEQQSELWTLLADVVQQLRSLRDTMVTFPDLADDKGYAEGIQFLEAQRTDLLEAICKTL